MQQSLKSSPSPVVLVARLRSLEVDFFLELNNFITNKFTLKKCAMIHVSKYTRIFQLFSCARFKTATSLNFKCF